MGGEVGLHDVSFSLPSAKQPTLRGIDLTVPAGHSLAVVGETGSGKTTLSYLIPRLYDVTSGNVTIDGIDVRDMSFDSLAAAVGVVSQETYLFHASVADNLRFAKPDASDAESSPRPRWRRSTTTSSPCPTGTTRSSGSAATGSGRRKAAPGDRPSRPAQPAHSRAGRSHQCP